MIDIRKDDSYVGGYWIRITHKHREELDRRSGETRLRMLVHQMLLHQSNWVPDTALAENCLHRGNRSIWLGVGLLKDIQNLFDVSQALNPSVLFA
jgi:hypothetical protein